MRRKEGGNENPNKEVGEKKWIFLFFLWRKRRKEKN
jgi:hypothetical protein